jgi:hypothetical protein
MIVPSFQLLTLGDCSSFPWLDHRRKWSKLIEEGQDLKDLKVRESNFAWHLGIVTFASLSFGHELRGGVNVQEQSIKRP